MAFHIYLSFIPALVLDRFLFDLRGGGCCCCQSEKGKKKKSKKVFLSRLCVISLRSSEVKITLHAFTAAMGELYLSF